MMEGEQGREVEKGMISEGCEKGKIERRDEERINDEERKG
jgi:hypothetical protein